MDLTQATLQEWALKKGLDANISSMSMAEKTMLRYQYVMDKTKDSQGDFARTQQSWSNQIKILRMQLQQLASTLGTAFINALKPLISALNTALSAIIKFSATVVNALGAIFGWKATISQGTGLADDFEGAAGSADDLADSTGAAAANAKKLKSHLLSIDELNVVEPDTDSAGGGSGSSGLGGGGLDATADDLIKIEETEDPFESTIKNLEELGSYIGDALIKAMDGIHWGEVYQKAKDFGKGLADFLNGLISPELFASLGTTIANALKATLAGLNTFGETFDWTNFGLSIAAGINAFFSSFDWALMAETLNVWAKGLLDALIAALENIDWQLIGTSIGTFLAGIDFLEIGKKLVEAIWLAIKGAWTSVEASFDIAPIETALGLLLVSPVIVGFGTKFVSLITTPLSKIRETIQLLLAPLKMLGEMLTTASAPAIGLGAALTALAVGLGVTYAKNEEVRDSFAEATKAIKDGLQPAIEFISDKVIPDLKSAWDGLKQIMSPLVDFIQGTFVSIWQDMINPALTTIGKEVLPAVTNAFEALWNNVLVPLGEFIGSILSPVIKSLSKILKTLWENVVVPLAQCIGEVFVEALKGLSEIFVASTEKVRSIINVMQNLWNNVLVPLGSYISSKFQPIFEKAFGVIKEVITSAKTTLKGLINFITGVFTGNWKKAWNGVKDIFKGVFNALISVAEGAINGIVSGINSFLKGFNKIVSTIGDKVGLNISIPIIPEVKLPRFATGGFPEDGLFMANSRELVGKFSNGKTAVANNEQIVEGIKRGVREAISEDLLPYLSNISAKVSAIVSGLAGNGIGFSGKTTSTNVAGAATTVSDLLAVDASAMSTANESFTELKMTLDFTAVKDAAVSALGEIQQIDFSSWFNDNVAAWFDEGLWNDTLQVVPNCVTAIMQGTQEILEGALNNIIDAVEITINNAVAAINALIDAMNSVPFVAVKVAHVSSISLERITIPELQGVETAIASDVAELSDLTSGGAVSQTSAAKISAETATDIAMTLANSITSISNAQSASGEAVTAAMMRELIDAVQEGKNIVVDGRSLVSAYDQRKARNGFSFT